jgi:hypothetical protein
MLRIVGVRRHAVNAMNLIHGIKKLNKYQRQPWHAAESPD